MPPSVPTQAKGSAIVSALQSKSVFATRLALLLEALGRSEPLFPNRLSSDAASHAAQHRFRPGLLSALLLLCFVPRLWMAIWLTTVCPDAPVYIHRAEAIDRGDWDAGLNHMRVNPLPFALAGLHRLGFDWEMAGKVWGLTMSTLVILPLFGWARRQFNDRIATLACVLYAIHPGLIERSPEILREPTFWFLTELSLYFSWRAASEARLRTFLLSGSVLMLAVLTRFEGVFLFLPLLGWTLARLLLPAAPRRRLCLGLLVAVIGIPAVLLLVGRVLAPDATLASLVRLDPLQRAELWLKSWAQPSEGDSAKLAMPLGDIDRKMLTFPRLLLTYIVMIGRGFDPIVALLLPASFIGWTTLWLRRDQLPLFLAAGGILLGAWIHLWYSHEVSSRYVLTVFLMITPLCALGICWPADKRRQFLPSKFVQNTRAQGGVSIAILLLLTIVGWSDALGSNYRGREAQAELGRRLGRHFETTPRVAGTPKICALVSYYAGSSLLELPPTVDVDVLMQAVEQTRPEVILVSYRQQELCQRLMSQAASWGMQPMPPGFFPPHFADHALLLVRAGQPAPRVSRVDAVHHPPH